MSGPIRSDPKDTRTLLAEFATAAEIAPALRDLRTRGYEKMDAYGPYPSHDITDALGHRRSPIAWYVFVAAMSGVVFAYVVQWLTAARLYPLNAGGRPPHAAPAFVPIVFETAILFGALTAVISLILRARLPRLWDQLDEIEGFERASVDRFWLSVETTDPERGRESLSRDLLDHGALRTVWVPRGYR